jgi:hypothetical protein
MTKRRKYCQFAALITLFIVLLTQNALPVQAQDPPPPTPAPFDPRFGIVDSFVNTAEANAARAGWSRVFFRWDVVQPGGPADWKPTNVPDTFLEAEIAAGRQLVAVLIGTPVWASESGASTAVPPLEYWGDFVYKITSQYQGRIKHWVIWNQPDVDDLASPNHTWAGSVEDYYRLLKEAYLKIKAVDPTMQVHVAGLTYTWDQERGQPQYLARLLDLIQADPEATNNNFYFDAVSYHLYFQPRQIYEALVDIRAILAAHNLAEKAIWLNEVNAPPSEDALEPLATLANPNVTLEEQSAFVVQAFAMALAGGAERIAFNKLRNDYPHPESVQPYGLLRADNSRRPAFTAFQTLATYFAGVQQASWQQQGDIYIVSLARDGQTTTVLWNSSPTAAFFTLNAIAPQATSVDEQGIIQPLTPTNNAYIVGLPGALCSNGAGACFIGGPPRLIIEAGSPDQRLALAPAGAQIASTTPTPDQTATVEPSPQPSPTSPPPPPTLTPTPAPAISQTNSHAGGAAPSQNSTVIEQAAPVSAPLAPPALAAPGVASNDETVVPAPTAIPPVTVVTVLRPERLFWLFIIGMIVFLVSYGVQVVVWYRMRR